MKMTSEEILSLKEEIKGFKIIYERYGYLSKEFDRKSKRIC